MEKKLPAGWVETNLENILISLENGSRPKGGVADIREGIPSLGGEHLTYNHEFSIGNMRYVPTEFAQKMNQGIIQQNDCLIVKDGATTGKTCFVGADFPFQKAVVNEHVFIARTSQTDFESKFLYYFLWSVLGQNQIKANITGTAQGGINQKFAKNVILPIPPLAEQKRIVSELDAVFTHVHAAQAELAKMPALIKMFRQKVLTMAVSGELTRDFRANTAISETAEILLEKIQKKRLVQATTPSQKNQLKSSFDFKETADAFSIPLNWKFTILDKLCLGFQYGTSQKSDNTGIVPVLRMGNLQKGEIDWDNLKYTSDAEEIEKYRLNTGDVLFNRTNSLELVGKTSIYRGEQPAIFAGYLIKIKNLPELNTEYLNYCLNSPYAEVWKKEVQVGAVNQSNINAEKLSKFEIPFCSLAEQAEIVRRVRELFTWCDAMESAYKTGVANLKILPQSLLQRAFSGTMLPQNAGDEPASKLLERVQAAKTLPQSAKKQIKIHF